MADARPFRVVIGGGGISGLTLANALEKADVDYILLEARDTIAPQVGASIGLFPNGGRIMDQLGCFQRLESKTVPLDIYYNRYANGEVVYAGDGTQLTARRFNYPTTFLEREEVLRTLYDNLKDKSKVNVAKRISKVDHNATEVIVLCEDGTAVSGDVLVGCDGVYSKVRQELWRISHLQEPLAIDSKDKEMLIAEYNCLFGISSHTDGVEEGSVNVNYSKDFSTMVIGGKGKLFWFMFKRLNEVYRMPNIPRYTKEDAEIFAANVQGQRITPKLTFRDIWRNRTSYTLVATEEAQLSRWSWGRIACVGDGVHKMTPNMGAGGNAAIETVAALANELKKMKDSSEKEKPSFEDIKSHLGNYQKIREKRVTAILKAANGLTRIHALKTWKDRLFAFHVLPYAGDMFTDLNCDMVVGAVKLDYLPVPDRSLHGTMPFNASQGLGQQESKLLRAIRALPFLAITATAIHFMWGVALPPALARIMEIMKKGVINTFGKAGTVVPLQSFYGVEFIDSRVRGLAACFASFQFVDVIGNWQSYTFLTDIGIVYAIVLIESARRANTMTLASVPILLGYNSQFFGIGVLMALYCFVHYVQSPIETFRAKDLRLTNMAYTASVLPVMILAHYIPNYASFSTLLDPQTRHKANWIWQPFPVYISILQFVLKKTVMRDTVQEDRIENVKRDLPTIYYTIGTLCAISAAVWWYTLASAPVSLATLFIPSLATGQNGDQAIRMFLQFDEIFSFGACFLWLLYLYADMKRAGMLDDSWISIVVKGTALLIAFGPGVAIGIGWAYRESVLATRHHRDALVPDKAR
ncbi:FAD binding domain protein [Paraphoma chrysanthemicola]|uniref:FAD binding domain protein n=1 Tax=Paraphoma chrysanthemicola TaxID=798071 RepID=A0A8K0VWZ9_9PLEO|nr:FAD binding domain protein [Paraphoma chrysanthemicola]